MTTPLTDEVLAELLAHAEASPQGRTHLTNPTVSALVREVLAARRRFGNLATALDGLAAHLPPGLREPASEAAANARRLAAPTVSGGGAPLTPEEQRQRDANGTGPQR